MSEDLEVGKVEETPVEEVAPLEETSEESSS